MAFDIRRLILDHPILQEANGPIASNMTLDGGEYPPGFTPTAFWFFPEWGEPDYSSRFGFKKPFWMNETIIPVLKKQKDIEFIHSKPNILEMAQPNKLEYNYSNQLWYLRLYCDNCNKEHRIYYSKHDLELGMHENINKFICNGCKKAQDVEFIEENEEKSPYKAQNIKNCSNCGRRMTERTESKVKGLCYYCHFDTPNNPLPEKSPWKTN